jgi:hypothetical protein
LLDVGELSKIGALLIPLVAGLVEFSKRLGLSGNWLKVEAFLLGLGFAFVAGAVKEGLIPQMALPWVRVIVGSLAGGVAGAAISGNYDLVMKILRKRASGE